MVLHSATEADLPNRTGDPQEDQEDPAGRVRRSPRPNDHTHLDLSALSHLPPSDLTPLDLLDLALRVLEAAIHQLPSTTWEGLRRGLLLMLRLGRDPTADLDPMEVDEADLDRTPMSALWDLQDLRGRRDQASRVPCNLALVRQRRLIPVFRLRKASTLARVSLHKASETSILSTRVRRFRWP